MFIEVCHRPESYTFCLYDGSNVLELTDYLAGSNVVLTGQDGDILTVSTPSGSTETVTPGQYVHAVNGMWGVQLSIQNPEDMKRGYYLAPETLQ